MVKAEKSDTTAEPQAAQITPEEQRWIQEYEREKKSKEKARQSARYRRRLEYQRAWLREKLDNDPAYRERYRASMKRVHEAPGYREKAKQYQREYRKKREADPEFLARHRECARQYAARRRERLANDAEYQMLVEAVKLYRLKARQAKAEAGRELAKEQRKALWRKKFHEDPEFRERSHQKVRQWKRDRRRERFFSQFQTLKERLQAHVERTADAEG
jgi:hypothetical protein